MTFLKYKRQSSANSHTFPFGQMILFVMGSVLILVNNSPVVGALSAEQKKLFDSGIYYFDPKAVDSSGCSISGSINTNGSLSANVPAVWRNLILEVAPDYPTVDPRIVASLLWAEHHGWPEYKASGWAASPKGAQGPWQMMPATWASIGTDGDGDGIKDPDNPKDAVHGAFKHNLGSAGKVISQEFTGNAEEGINNIVFKRSLDNLLFYSAKYNGGPVDEGGEAPDGVKLKDFPRNENADYVIMNYWLLATDFLQGYSPESNSLVDATSIGKTGQLASSLICPTGSGVVSTDGYSFPVAPQRKSQNSGIAAMSPLPCSSDSCHHSESGSSGGYAFDISRKPGGNSVVGTPVYAISDGEIKRVNPAYDNIAGCQSLQLASKDGYWYWYGHIQQTSVNENQQVTAGQQLAVIGESKCAKDTSPHLHIDRGSPKGNEGGNECCRDRGIIPLINSLFESLPE